jgi:DNA-binding response OmpR family regulator
MNLAKNISILIVEDDINLGYLLKENLEINNFSPMLCTDGEEGLRTFLNNKYDMCIVDIMLPKLDGVSLVKEIRSVNKKIPVIFLTSKTSESDKIAGFKTGADDYITKPFSFTELLLRMEAILKRTHGYGSGEQDSTVYDVGNLRFDYPNRVLSNDTDRKILSAKEAELLKLFCDNQGKLLSRSIILNKIWGHDDYFLSKSLDVYLTKLRKLLKTDPSIEIVNLYGTGFKLQVK